MYMIANDEGDYWSNEFGWVAWESADTFTPNEMLELNLPIGGRWVLEHE